MGYLEGSRTGYEQTVNPFATALNQIDATIKRRREEAIQREKEDRSVAQVFAQLAKQNEYAQQQAKDKAIEERKTKRFESELSGDTLPLGSTPMGAVGQAMQPQQDPMTSFGQEQGINLQDYTGEEGQVMVNPSGPSAIKKEKSRLDLEKARFEQQGRTPEGIRKKMETDILEKEVMTSSANIPKLENAFNAIKQLKQQFDKSANSKSVKRGDVGAGIANKFYGMKKSASAAIGADAELKTYLNNRKSFASLISKGGFLESGVLTNQDIQRVLNSLPDEYSSTEEANAGWREIDLILQSGLENYNKKKEKLFSSLGANGTVKENKSGGIRMRDAQGNEAIIYPDGTVEEL